MHSPLLGFNNNVKHKGKVFHLQTEDSGVKHPHVITHLFADGGRILKTVKTSYAEHVGNERLSDIVRELMKEQHKAMFIALRDGQFDGLIQGTGSSNAIAGAVPPPLVVDAARAAIDGPARDGARGLAHAPTAVTVAPDLRPPVRQQAPELFTASAPLAETSIDLAALERSAMASEDGAGSFAPGGDLPPPPPTVLGKKPDGTYRHSSDRARTQRDRSPIPAAAAAASSGRYAASRPATIFANARPESGSIFGEELISEKSLDEVILSYLAEDLDSTAAPKK